MGHRRQLLAMPSFRLPENGQPEEGQFLGRSHFTLIQLLDILYIGQWNSHNYIKEQAKVSEKMVVDWYHMIREVCSSELLASPCQFGGPEHVIAFDKSIACKLWVYGCMTPRQSTSLWSSSSYGMPYVQDCTTA